MNLLALKAILFDFGGTLDSDGIPWKDRFFPIYREAGLDWDFPAFEKFFFAADDSLTEETLADVGYGRMLLEQVTRVLKAGQRYEARLAQTIADRFYQDSMKYLKRNEPLMAKLAARYKLGIVSNFYGNLPFIFHEIGYDRFFKVVIDSARVGVIKPHAGIFQAALDALGCKADETVFVGDHPMRDMGGAKALGIAHIWVDGFGGPERKPCCPDDPVIRSLSELEGLLL